MKVCCVFSFESPHRGDSNEYTQHAIINIKKKITLNHPKYNNVCSYGIFSKGLKNEFETAVVNEPSVFEPLKFYCSLCLDIFTTGRTRETSKSGLGWTLLAQLEKIRHDVSSESSAGQRIHLKNQVLFLRKIKVKN